VGLVGEELALPPDLDHVVQARRPAAAVEALEQALHGREGGVFFGRQGGPDKVHAFEVGVAVVHHVVAGVPQAVGRDRGQEGDAAQQLVEVAVRRQALVAGVVANDEQAADHEAGGQAAQQLGPDGVENDGSGDQREEQGVVDGQQHEGAQCGAVGQGDQPLTDDLAVRQGLVQGNGLLALGRGLSSHVVIKNAYGKTRNYLILKGRVSLEPDNDQ